MAKTRDLKFFQKKEHQKIFDKWLGVLQNFDQRSDEALEYVFLNIAKTLEWMNPET